MGLNFRVSERVGGSPDRSERSERKSGIVFAAGETDPGFPLRFKPGYGYSGITAVASISILAAFSTSPATCTTAIAGK